MSQLRDQGTVPVHWLTILAMVALVVGAVVTLTIWSPAGFADYRRWPGDVLNWARTHLLSVAVASLPVAIGSPFLEARLSRSGDRVGAGDQRRRAQDRARMLARVRHRWIEGVLDRSLAQEARLLLGLERAPDAIYRRELGRPFHIRRFFTSVLPVFAQIMGLVS